MREFHSMRWKQLKFTNQKIKPKDTLKSNEMQLPLEKSKIKSKLKDLDEFKTEKELKEYLKTLDLSEVLEIYYIQSYEISRIRKIILNSVKNNNK